MATQGTQSGGALAQVDRYLASLEARRSNWRQEWRDIADVQAPHAARFETTDAETSGKRLDSKLIDPTARLAARTMANGLMSALTSPAQEWFSFSHEDRSLADRRDVRSWLNTASRQVLSVFSRSNYYRVLPALYRDLGVFGTASEYLQAHGEKVIVARHLPIGSYVIDSTDGDMVDVVMRRFQMTVAQLVDRFGDAVSDQVKSHWQTARYDVMHEVVHAVFPSELFGGKIRTLDRKPYTEVYYQCSGAGSRAGGVPSDDGRFLSVAGYHEFPFPTARWDTLGEDVYGRGPGWDARGIAKSLQLKHRRLLQAAEYNVNPPVQAPESLRQSGVRMLPGSVNYYNAATGAAGIRPLYEMRFPTEDMGNLILQDRDVINQIYYADLFLLLAHTDRREITAREIVEKKEEKLLQLGPVYQSLTTELLEPAVQRVLGLLVRQGRLPEPPEELAGEELRVEYNGVLAQAMRLLRVANMERLVAYTGEVSQLDPSVLDKVDLDETVDVMAQTLAVDPQLVRSDEQIQELRRQRAEQQQQQALIEQTAQAADTAQNLANTPTTGENALNALLGGSL